MKGRREKKEGGGQGKGKEKRNRGGEKGEARI